MHQGDKLEGKNIQLSLFTKEHRHEIDKCWYTPPDGYIYQTLCDLPAKSLATTVCLVVWVLFVSSCGWNIVVAAIIVLIDGPPTAMSDVQKTLSRYLNFQLSVFALMLCVDGLAFLCWLPIHWLGGRCRWLNFPVFILQLKLLYAFKRYTDRLVENLQDGKEGSIKAKKSLV